jgi:hypothetical protein
MDWLSARASKPPSGDSSTTKMISLAAMTTDYSFWIIPASYPKERDSNRRFIPVAKFMNSLMAGGARLRFGGFRVD